MPNRFYWSTEPNFGDRLTPIVFGHFLKRPIGRAERDECGKVLGIGSILTSIRDDDIVLGSGAIDDRPTAAPPGVRFLLVRGPLTRSRITGAEVPETFGDPALLLPLIYRPDVERKHLIGFLPHYVDKELVRHPSLCTCVSNNSEDRLCAYCLEQFGPRGLFIDVQAPWQKVVDNVLSCELIVTSSLHGIICADAYGLPSVWVRYSDRIKGREFKYHDHFGAMGRNHISTGDILKPPKHIVKLQQRILDAIGQLD